MDSVGNDVVPGRYYYIRKVNPRRVSILTGDECVCRKVRTASQEDQVVAYSDNDRQSEEQVTYTLTTSSPARIGHPSQTLSNPPSRSAAPY